MTAFGESSTKPVLVMMNQGGKGLANEIAHYDIFDVEGGARHNFRGRTHGALSVRVVSSRVPSYAKVSKPAIVLAPHYQFPILPQL